MTAVAEFASADAPELLARYVGEARTIGAEFREIVFTKTVKLLGTAEEEEIHRGVAYFLGRSHEPGGGAGGHAKDHHRSWFMDEDGWLSSFTSYQTKPGTDGAWLTDTRFGIVAFVEAFGPWHAFHGREPQRMEAANPSWYDALTSVEQARRLLNQHFERHFSILLLEAATADTEDLR